MKNKKLFIDKIACVILTLAMVFSLNINSFFIFAAELDTNSTENNIESSEILDVNGDDKSVDSEETINTKDEKSIDKDENNKSEENTEKENIISEEETSNEEAKIEDTEKINELIYEDKKIKVTVYSEKGFQKETTLNVSKLKQDSKEYEDYEKDTLKEMKKIGYNEIDNLQLYDISLIYNNEEIEPDGTVSVKIEYPKSQDINIDELNVIHFTNDEKPEVVKDINIVKQVEELQFDTDSFSVYAIVEGVYVEDPDDRNIHTIDDIDGQDVYIYGILNNTYYAKDGFITVKNVRCLTRSTNNESEGVLYHFTKVPGTDNQFYIQHSETNQYLCMNATGNMSFDANTGTEFTIEYFNDGIEEVFYIYRYGNNNQKYCINIKGGDATTGGFGGSTYKDNGSRILLLKPEESIVDVGDDPYGLNNKTYGLVLNKKTDSEGALSAAMMSEVKYMRFTAQQLLEKPDPSEESEGVFVYIGNDISLWTFHYESGLNYYISTEIDGQTKYICLNGPDVSLVDEVNNNCLFKIESDEDIPGKYRFVSNNYAMSLREGSISKGFGGLADTGGYNSNQWFNLVEPSQFTDDVFTTRYSAHKISVSDERVTNGTQVIVYTRVWNADKEKYEFWAIDHNGALVPCYNVGSTIWWQSGPINTMVWDFTEYYYEGTTDPNYYYELQNTYSEKYLAPQIHSGGQIISNNPIGININGRRYNDYYSKILAWDDPNYDYAGFMVEDGQLKVVPMSKACEWYFAIPELNLEELTTIDTVDNDDHGISMKMKKYTGTIYGSANNRNQEQTDVLGSDLEAYEALVSRELGPDGYPIALNTNQSLSSLFEDGIPVNHLFSSEKYHESGYFEYDCTQNYAYLNGNNFDVYNAIGSFDTKGKSSQHGQFMPYDNLTPGYFSTGNYNVTDVINNELPDSDPRKGMDLYCINRKTAHYFFGMEMSADFMQTPSGCDQFGNDLIFEFSGDDDMWLYIDGELVLDLGGVHSAFTGNINYKTGNVHIDRSAQNAGIINTTLRDIFEENYRLKNPTASNAEVNNYLDEIFDGNTFKDYTAHSMKMLYMERGAGSSNLRMRFNLTTVEDGQVLLQKKLSGTDKQDYLSLEFPYKIMYKDPDTQTWKYLKQELYDSGYAVVYHNETQPVKTSEDGETFYLKPGEIAEVNFSSDDVEYKIIETNVDTRIYDVISGNDTVIFAENEQGDFADYATSISKVGSRKQVVYDNHVDPEAQRSLLITKKLFDEQGNPLHKSDDPTTFRFRVYLGKNSNNEYEYYRLGSYYVKDEHGNYCKYEEGEGFVSLGKSSLHSLTEEELDDATFTTSPSGAVDKIPADYSVEITGLLIGTSFKVEERESDIPKGYSLSGYTRVAGTYIISDGDTENSGVIRDNANPHIEVNNDRGWGLTAKKTWTDDTFMKSHETIYLGVYHNGDIIPNTIREYTSTTKELYWYFPSLLLGSSFNDYQIREVKLTNPIVNDEGYVTSYDNIEIIHNGDETLLSGTTLLNEEKDNLKYIVNYEEGDISGVSNNLREDEVINIAEGLRITKTDMSGNYISGGKFILEDSEGNPVGAEQYSANRTGLITTVYLHEGTYTLTEVSPPQGYIKLLDSINISIDEGGNVTVSDTENCSIVNVDNTLEIQIKNEQAEFKAIKMDEELEHPLPGTIFALYKEIQSNNGPMKDYRPMEGYENLVVDSEGIIPKIDMTLKQGTYYLEERSPVTGYIKGEDVKFTITADDKVVLNSGDAILEDIDDHHLVENFVLKIKNREYNKLQLKKISYGTNRPLSGAVFELYKSSDFNTVTNTPFNNKQPVASGTTNNQGIMGLGSLPNGEYYLYEITPPEGHKPLATAIKINVTSTMVTVSNSDMATVNHLDNIFEIEVQNIPYVLIPTKITPNSSIFIIILLTLIVAVVIYCNRNKSLLKVLLKK